MRIGLALPAMLHGLDRRLLLDWARRIEADGYSSVGFGERIAYRNLEMFSVLSAAAAVTERVDIAASVVVLPMHSEVWVAKQMATLDVISGGRAVLGVGVGGRLEDYRALGRSVEPALGSDRRPGPPHPLGVVRDRPRPGPRPGGAATRPPDPDHLGGRRAAVARSQLGVGGRDQRLRAGPARPRAGARRQPGPARRGTRRSGWRPRS